MSWLDDPIAAAVALPPLALALFVFFSALLEYLFPPYWGDTFVLLGFFLAGQGAVAPAAVFAAAAAGSFLGSIAAYHLGRRYGLVLAQRLAVRRRRPSRRRVRALFQRFGEKLLLVNRFLPVVRGIMLYAAGALRLRPRPVIFYSTLSNLAFIGLLMWAGLWTADSWPEIRNTFGRSNRWLAAAALAATGTWLASSWWRKRGFGISSQGPSTGEPGAAGVAAASSRNQRDAGTTASARDEGEET